jgi:hypothetical protein
MEKRRQAEREVEECVEGEAGEGEIEQRDVSREPAAERDTSLEGEQKLKEP